MCINIDALLHLLNSQLPPRLFAFTPILHPAFVVDNKYTIPLWWPMSESKLLGAVFLVWPCSFDASVYESLRADTMLGASTQRVMGRVNILPPILFNSEANEQYRGPLDNSEYSRLPCHEHTHNYFGSMRSTVAHTNERRLSDNKRKLPVYCGIVTYLCLIKNLRVKYKVYDRHYHHQLATSLDFLP